MDSTAFTRARRFLNYHPVAQGIAITSSVLTAFLFFALLLLLALLLDLVVGRGEVPCLWQLPAEERASFLAERAVSDEQARETLTALRLPATELRHWLAGEAPDKLPYRERALAWYVAAIGHVHDAVGADAAALVVDRLRHQIETRGLDSALAQPVGDVGMLGRVVRARGNVTGWLAATLAAWNAWTWAEGNDTELIGLFVLALIVAATRFGLLYLSNYAATLAALEAVTRLRRAIYHHTHRLGVLALESFGPRDAIRASVRDVEAVHDALYRWLTVFFREPVKAALLLLLALAVHFWLALAFLLFAVLVWLLGWQAARILRRRGRAAQARAAEQLGFMQESLTLTRLVKIYLMETFNQARVERQLRAYTEAQLARQRDEALYRPLFATLGLVAALVLFLAAGYLVLAGELGVTGAALLATALVALYWPVRAMLDTRRALRRGGAAAREVFAFLDRPGGVGQAIEAEFLPGMTRALELDKVTLQEPGTGRKLLRGASLRVEAGQRVALVGPDDLEKYALVSLLPRFLDPTSGEVRIDGKNLRWVTLDSLRAQIAMLLQQDLVFNDTVANNIGCGDPAFNLHRIVEAAKTAHAHQFIQKLPKGYETPIGDAGHPLNAGERFRIALARAILRDPALFVIEEPAAVLDDDTKSLIDDTMQRVLPGRTVIFLPHRLSTIRNCDQVFLLHQGRIVAAGEHRDLLATNDLYKHLQYLQFNEFAGLLGGTPAATPVAEDAHSS